MKKSLFSLILLTLMMFPLTVTSANNDTDTAFTLEAAEVVIAAFSDIEVKDGLHPHLSPYLLEISRNGHSLPTKIKDQLKAVGFNFSRDFVTWDRPILDYYYDRDSFRFHYNLTGTDSVSNIDISPENGIPNYVEQMADVFTEIYNLEINELGYETPPPEDGIGHYDGG